MTVGWYHYSLTLTTLMFYRLHKVKLKNNPVVNKKQHWTEHKLKKNGQTSKPSSSITKNNK